MPDSVLHQGVVRMIIDEGGTKFDGCVSIEVDGDKGTVTLNSQSPTDPAVLSFTTSGGGGAVPVLNVADITAPTELNSRAGGSAGELVLVYETAVIDRFTLYAYDPLFVSETVPLVMQADTAGQWVAIGGAYNYERELNGTDNHIVRFDGSRDVQDSSAELLDNGSVLFTAVTPATTGSVAMVAVGGQTRAAIGFSNAVYDSTDGGTTSDDYSGGYLALKPAAGATEFRLVGPRDILSSYDLAVPEQQGTAGQYLRLDYVASGTGHLIWATPPTTLPPSGSAGGDLTGTYPNPSIANGAVGVAKLASATAGQIIDFGGGSGAARVTDSPIIGGDTRFQYDPYGFVLGRYEFDPTTTGMTITSATGPALATSNGTMGELRWGVNPMFGQATWRLRVPIVVDPRLLGRPLRITGCGFTMWEEDQSSLIDTVRVLENRPDPDANTADAVVIASDSTGWDSPSSANYKSVAITFGTPGTLAGTGVVWLEFEGLLDSGDIFRPVEFGLCADSIYLTADTL